MEYFPKHELQVWGTSIWKVQRLAGSLCQGCEGEPRFQLKGHCHDHFKTFRLYWSSFGKNYNASE